MTVTNHPSTPSTLLKYITTSLCNEVVFCQQDQPQILKNWFCSQKSDEGTEEEIGGKDKW